MEKKKRVVTRIGNIFCVEIDQQYKCYFQYVANDWTQLNSTVIRVFKKRYSLESNPTMDEIVNDEVSFYAHTILRVGLYFNAWYKVGTSKNVGNTENIMFRWYKDVNYSNRTKSYNWKIWKISEPTLFVGEMNDEYRKYNLGIIFSYDNIVSKIATGKFLLKILE